MNGEMEAVAQDQVWAQEDLLKSSDSMKVALPQKDVTKYKTSESHLDWNKVAFNSFTAEMCKQKWQEVSKEIRKFRTLTESIVDAQDYIKNPYKGKKLKKHPDFPKKPLTPYFRFFMEKRAKYAKLHPEMSNLDLTKILSKKYRELPDKKKKKYVDDFLRDKEIFVQSMIKFREEHPDLMESITKKGSNVPEKPKTPQQSWYNHEKKAFLKTRPDATTKDIKDSLGKQWTQSSDKKRLKWISKSSEQQKSYEETMREYIQQHPESNMTQGDIKKSTSTKAERHLKDKSDGRPDKPPPNGYSMFCAESMSNMKDVPSTERMVMCSQRWKLSKQNEKDAYQKRCEQRKKEYEIEMNRFLSTLSEKEQQRVLGEDKIGFKKNSAASSPAAKKKNAKTNASTEKPKRPISAMFIFAEEKRPKSQQERPDIPDSESTRLSARMWNESPDKKKEKYKRVEALSKAESEKKEREERSRSPDPPKTAQEIWQQSVIGDYLARFKNDRPKAHKAMETAWSTMEKKEKIMWIKKAAEDQKRYERDSCEMRSPANVVTTVKKMKFEGEPKKPPSNGYQKFSQEMSSNGESNHLPMKERMAEIGSRWQRSPSKDKERYKKIAEEKQRQYKVLSEQWLASLSSQERNVYREYNSQKRRNPAKPGGAKAKFKKSDTEEEEDEDDDDDDDDQKASSDADSSSEEDDDDEDEDDNDDDDDDDDDDEDDDDEVDDKENKSDDDSSSESNSAESSESDSD